MVIGPTPPGTGVIAPATSIASSKATSPSSLRVPSGCSTRSWPTSMTVAPGFSQPPRISSGPADGGDDDVGAANDVGQVAGPRMGDGHRAIRLQQQLRHRLADDVRPADDHRFFAAEVAKLALEQHAGSRAACTGTSASSPIDSRPTLTG